MISLVLTMLLSFPQSSLQAVPDQVVTGAERIWVGPGFWGNRLQDWRLRNGRFECVEQAERFPLRTLMVLDHAVDALQAGELQLDMLVGALDPSPSDTPTRGFAGFLIGAGGSHVDYRISAQVHHRPAQDGGMLAVVNRRGEVTFFDNSQRLGSGGSWSIGGPLKEGELREFTSQKEIHSARSSKNTAMRLHVAVRKTATPGLEVEVSCYEVSAEVEDRLLSRAVVSDLPPTFVDGLFGLISHLGPANGHAGFWFSDLKMAGGMLQSFPERRYGPVLGVQYTVSHNLLKLTAQLPPLGPAATSNGELQMHLRDGSWQTVASAPLRQDCWTLPFRVENWNHQHAVDFRVRYEWQDIHQQPQIATYTGTISAEPQPTQEMVVASLNCAKHYVGNLAWNHSSIWFPHAEVAERVAMHNPHLLYFAGDQLYEGDLDPVDARSTDKLILDYLYKWYRWQWSFGELTRRLPTVTIPDDHDVYHGNLWGAGGRKAVADKERGISQQDSGGYKYAAEFVNVVHATQTSHLPDPVDPAPSLQNISVYFTEMDYGGISFAILSDRQFKDSASDVVPDGQVKNGWFQAPGFDPRLADVNGAHLLGERQQKFLAQWAQEWDHGAWMKVLLSQTPFVNVATIPANATGGGVLPSLPIPQRGAYPEGYKFAADTDSGGWPQTPRNRAVRALSSCFAVHLAGDQHLGSLVEYGADEFRDGGFVFTSPAIANTWPRRWWPPFFGANPEKNAPHYTGDFHDGFGNKMTVWAVSNPVDTDLEPAALYDRTPGYGIIRFQPKTREITFECWPRWVDPTEPHAKQYEGWPRTISQFDNGAASVFAWLPACKIPFTHAVASVYRMEKDGARLCYRLPVSGPQFRIPVFSAGDYLIKVISEESPQQPLHFPGLRITESSQSSAISGD